MNNRIKVWLCTIAMSAIVTASNAAPIWTEDFSQVNSTNGSTAVFTAASGVASQTTPPTVYVPGSDTYGYTGYMAATTASTNPYTSTVTVQTDAVGTESGFLFSNSTSEPINIGFEEETAYIPYLSSLAGWTAGSVTAAELSTLSLTFDYVTSGSMAVQVGVQAINGGAWLESALYSSSTPGTATFNFSSLTDAQLQTLATNINAGNDLLGIQLNSGGTMGVGDSVGFANLAITEAAVPEPSTWLLTGLGGLFLVSRFIVRRKELTYGQEI